MMNALTPLYNVATIFLNIQIISEKNLILFNLKIFSVLEAEMSVNQTVCGVKLFNIKSLSDTTLYLSIVIVNI